MTGGFAIKERTKDEQEIWSVSDLVSYLRSSLETDPKLRRLWVKGEISNFIHHERSGHMYFTLKDKETKIKAAMFARRNRRLSFVPKNGDAVFVRGKISVYERDGQMQLYVQEMQMSGLGDLYLAYQNLKEKLEQKGYFTAPKKPLPRFPRTVGVITSPSGAVIRDIITTIGRRFPAVKILLYPVSVQGPTAANEIAHAIDEMDRLSNTDVLIVGRGGGSLEELWAFNEEVVADSIYRASLPVVSAVGHETDITISDFVADVRAATPTAAAELVVPHIEDVTEEIEKKKQRLSRAVWAFLEKKKKQLLYCKERPLFTQPQSRYTQIEQRLDTLTTQLKHQFTLRIQKKLSQFSEAKYRLKSVAPIQKVENRKEVLTHLTTELSKQVRQQLKDKHRKLLQLNYGLDALSPLKVMQRGYSVVYRYQQDQILSSAQMTQVGDLIRVRFVDGELKCQIWSVEEWKNET